jgi:hypothetical protein
LHILSLFSGKLSFVTPTFEDSSPSTAQPAPDPVATLSMPPEIGGRKGPEPTRFGDWEFRGRCIDF